MRDNIIKFRSTFTNLLIRFGWVWNEDGGFLIISSFTDDDSLDDSLSTMVYKKLPKSLTYRTKEGNRTETERRFFFNAKLPIHVKILVRHAVNKWANLVNDTLKNYKHHQLNEISNDKKTIMYDIRLVNELDPRPEREVPSQPVPSQPVPSQPVPSQPVPSQTVPSQPVPSQTVPSQPVPSQPVPSQPVPSQPVPPKVYPVSKSSLQEVKKPMSSILSQQKKTETLQEEVRTLLKRISDPETPVKNAVRFIYILRRLLLSTDEYALLNTLTNDIETMYNKWKQFAETKEIIAVKEEENRIEDSYLPEPLTDDDPAFLHIAKSNLNTQKYVENLKFIKEHRGYDMERLSTELQEIKKIWETKVANFNSQSNNKDE
jgi:hypothetical protein